MQQSVPNPPHQVIHIVEAPNEKTNIKDAYKTKAATVLGVLHIICGVISLIAESAYLDSSNSIIKWLRSHDPMVARKFEPFETGMWTSVLFFISGGLAIGGARSGNKCLVVATLVMSIISALVAGSLIFTSAVHLSFLDAIDIKYYDKYYDRLHNNDYYKKRYRDYYKKDFDEDWKDYSYFKTEENEAESALKLLITLGVMMLGVAIASASLTCKPLCCRSTNQGTVHYNPNQGSFIPNQVPTSVLVNPNYNSNQIASVQATQTSAQVIWRKYDKLLKKEKI